MKTNNTLTVVSIITISFLLSQCNTKHPQGNAKLEEAKAAIAASNNIYFEAFAKGDSSIFINRYAKDCCILAPNAPAMCGEQAALNFFRVAYHDIGLRNGKFITTAVYGDGEDVQQQQEVIYSISADRLLKPVSRFRYIL